MIFRGQGSGVRGQIIPTPTSLPLTPKKVLAIAGSPRKKGNTETLLEATLKGCEKAGAEVEKVFLRDLSIRPCQECYGCLKAGLCVIQDDMQPLYEKLTSYPYILLSTPVFFMNVTAQTKAMIDRCQALWVKKYILKQKTHRLPEARGMLLSTSGLKREDVFDCSIKTVKAFFSVVGVKYEGGLFYSGMDEQGAIQNHPTALKEADEAGERLLMGKG